MLELRTDSGPADTPGVIAGYRLLAPLGRGSSASVFRASPAANDAPHVAVKLFRQAEGIGLDQRVQFEHEAALLGHLSHPGIVRLLAHGTQGAQPYLVTELAAGRSLAQILADDGPLPPAVVAELIRQLALALAHAHGQRILHRDIKPSNVVVADDAEPPVAKLLDFGFARQQGNDAGGGARPTVGTFLYMSPEQLGILAFPPDERSDLYALGIVAIELLAGRHPFAGLGLRDLIHAHAAITPAIPAQTPPALAQIIALLARKDPADRYRTAEGLAADLETFLARQRAGHSAPFPLRTQDRHAELVAPRYFGRADERLRLAEAYEAAAHGLQIVALAGVSGMGKTRLIGEAARGWSRSPVLWGRGRAFGQTAGYGLVAEALRALAGQPLSAAMQAAMRAAVGTMGGELLALVPELRPLLGDAAAIAPLVPEHQQQRLFTLLAALLATLGTPEAPLVLILDDLQWADDGSLQFVLHLARRTEPRALLLVLAWRDEEVSAGGRVHQWLDQVRAARAGAPITAMTLRPLGLPELRTLVASMLGNDVPGVAEAVEAQAQGHPLHAIELTHAMVERGLLRHGSQGWHLEAAAATRLAHDTDDLLQTIVRRLDRLGAADREVLAIAAVTGRGFAAETVRRVLQQETHVAPELAARRTVAALAAAEQAQLVVADAQQAGLHGFVHDKIREALYDALPAEHRARLHERIGDALAATAQGGNAQVYALAHHYAQGRDAAKAVDAAMRAGALARQHYAHLEALGFYAQATRGLGQLEPAARAALAPRLTEAMADSQVATGRFDEACAAYQSLLPLPRAPEAMAELRRKLAVLLLLRGDATQSARMLEEALAALGAPVPAGTAGVMWQLAREMAVQTWHSFVPPRGAESRDPKWVTLGSLYFQLSNVYAFIDVNRAISIHLRHMNVMERAQAVEALAPAYAIHGPACGVAGLHARGIRYMERSLALRHAQGDRWGAAQSQANLVMTLLAAGRWDEAFANGRACIAELEQQGDPYSLTIANGYMSLGLGLAGRWDEAARACDHALLIAHGQGQLTIRGYAFVGLAEIAARRDLAALIADADDLLAQRSERSDLLSLCMVLRAKGRALMLQGRLGEAEAALAEGTRIVYERNFRVIQVIETMLDHVDVLLQQARHASEPSGRAEALARGRRALRRARLFAIGFPTLRPSVLRLRARSSWLRGKPAPAMRLWRDALAAAHELGMVHQQALGLAEWGTALGEREAAADRQRSSSLRASAALLFEAMGARHELARWGLAAAAALPTADAAATSAASSAGAAKATAEDQAATPRFDPALPPPATESRGPASSSGRQLIEAERMRALLAIAQQLSGTHDIETLLQAIVDSAARLLGAERGMLYLWNVGRSAYGCHTRFGDAEAMAAPVSSSVLDGVLRVGAGAVVADAQADPGLDTAPSVMSSGVRSILCAPLTHQGEVLGALYLDNRLMRGLFAARDLELLQALASQASVALQNAQLYRQLEDHRADLEETVRKRTAEADEARRIAESATRAKGDFLANMSHEIRTPMNAILGMSHLALQSGLNPRQHNFVSKVERSAQSLLGLINDILDFSKIEAGKLDMERVRFTLGSVTGELAELLGPRAREKGLAMHETIAPDVPQALVGDPLRLRQVLLNLCNNAIKFTERGEVALTVDVLARTASSVSLSFTVRDTGVGMTEPQRLGLFQPFVQADSSITRRYGGTGLGLAISRQLVELMRGTIEAESEPGHGSTFRFSAHFDLPAAQDAPAPPAATLHGLRLLVVEDNAATRACLLELAGSLGLQAQAASDGWDALRAVTLASRPDDPQALAFDLILIDRAMPGMDGVECAAQLRAGPHAHGALVMMSEPHERAALELALAERAVEAAWVAKPATASGLFDACCEALARRPPPLDHAALAGPDSPPPAEPARWPGARALLVEDNEINRELAQELLTDAGFVVTLAEHGRQAIEVLAQQDFDVVLMDCQMPVMDGYEATREIRLDERWKSLPIIAMTANAMAGDRDKALAAGMNDHIAKPIVVSRMFETIGRWLKRA